MQTELRQLREQVKTLNQNQRALLDKEVESYLEDQKAYTEAYGSERRATDRVRVAAFGGFTSAHTVNLDSDVGGNEHRLDGQLYINWSFMATDNLTIFADTVANWGNRGFPTFPIITGSGFIEGFDSRSQNGNTYGGSSGGLGLNATAPRVDADGSIDLYQGGMRWTSDLSGTKLTLYMGKLDVRRYYLNGQFTENEWTDFINNLYQDGAALPWRSAHSAAIIANFVFASNFWLTLGWINTFGEFYSNGQFVAEIGWSGMVRERKMTVALAVLIEGRADDNIGIGFNWDWMIAAQWGLFLRFNWFDTDPQFSFFFIEFDVSIGVIYTGFNAARPNDKVGLAVGLISFDDDLGPDDEELHLELFYVWTSAREDGKLQITPYIQWVNDPIVLSSGGEDTLFIIGFRVYFFF